jgi:hypothetical protein
MAPGTAGGVVRGVLCGPAGRQGSHVQDVSCTSVHLWGGGFTMAPRPADWLPAWVHLAHDSAEIARHIAGCSARWLQLLNLCQYASSALDGAKQPCSSPVGEGR